MKKHPPNVAHPHPRLSRVALKLALLGRHVGQSQPLVDVGLASERQRRPRWPMHRPMPGIGRSASIFEAVCVKPGAGNTKDARAAVDAQGARVLKTYLSLLTALSLSP